MHLKLCDNCYYIFVQRVENTLCYYALYKLSFIIIIITFSLGDLGDVQIIFIYFALE